MDSDVAGAQAASDASGTEAVTHRQGGPYAEAVTADATHAVSTLYAEHALGLTRLAFLVLGDRFAAEDVVQEAFWGLYRTWDRLPSHDNVLGYVRVSVLNGCRSVIRRARRVPRPVALPHAASAEADALSAEEQRAAVAAVRRLPARQREAAANRL